MNRMLIVTIDGKTGEIDACFGEPDNMKEITDDFRSVRANSVLCLPFDGGETGTKAIDVAWEAHLIQGGDGGTMNLRTMVEEIVKLGAIHHRKVLSAMRKWGEYKLKIKRGNRQFLRAEVKRLISSQKPPPDYPVAFSPAS